MFTPRLIRRPRLQAAVAWSLACWLAFLSTATVAPRMAAAGPDAASVGAICTLAPQGQGDDASVGGAFCPVCATAAGFAAALPAHAVPVALRRVATAVGHADGAPALPVHARAFAARGPPQSFV